MKRLSLTLSLFLVFTITYSQTFSTAVDYLNYISVEYRTISSGVLSYTSAVAHGKSARKVDKKRTEMMNNIKNAQTKIKKMPDFKGNTALRDTALAVLNLDYIVLNEDYAKIIDMEAVAEQSYDAMEAYLMAQDLADEKLEEAGDRLNAVQDEFILANNITVVDNSDKDELQIKMKKSSEVSSYHRVIYLTFFKAYKQEMYMIDALNRSDINALEQNKNSLITYSEEGLKVLDTIKPFENDNSLVQACKNMLTFYKTECEKQIPVIVDFLLKNENFNKVKAAFEAKKEKERTQKDVDEFNKAVAEVNEASKEYNATNEKMNKSRNDFINKYNEASSKFMDKHIPKFK